MAGFSITQPDFKEDQKALNYLLLKACLKRKIEYHVKGIKAQYQVSLLRYKVLK